MSEFNWNKYDRWKTTTPADTCHDVETCSCEACHRYHLDTSPERYAVLVPCGACRDYLDENIGSGKICGRHYKFTHPSTGLCDDCSMEATKEVDE